MTDLCNELKGQLAASGAALVGFADTSGLPREMTDGLPRGISIAVRLDPTVIRGIASGPTQAYLAEYNRANKLLADLCDGAADLLTNAGHRANPAQTTSEHFDPVTLSMPLQHKTIATRAGLGWIGKSALLVTKRYGPAVRLGSVLTDAPLVPGTPVSDSHCGACANCVDRCPAGAIVGDNWELGAPRVSIYRAPACRAMASKLSGREGIEVTICGICINACPWTQRYLAREKEGTGHH